MLFRGLPAGCSAFVSFVTLCGAANSGLVFSSAAAINSSGETDGIAVDSAGNSYIAGRTRAAGLKTTLGVVQPQYPGGLYDIFVMKLDPSGNVVFSTFWGGGGSDNDEALSIAVDPSGFIYVAGLSISNGASAFPTTPGAAFRTGGPSGADGFVFKLNPTGTAVVYSTLVPGAGQRTRSNRR